MDQPLQVLTQPCSYCQALKLPTTVILDLTHMKEVLTINSESVTVQAGISFAVRADSLALVDFFSVPVLGSASWSSAEPGAHVLETCSIA